MVGYHEWIWQHPLIPSVDKGTHALCPLRVLIRMTKFLPILSYPLYNFNWYSRLLRLLISYVPGSGFSRIYESLIFISMNSSMLYTSKHLHITSNLKIWYPQWTKGHTVGEEPIFAPVSLLSFRVRPVRVNQAPRRDKNWLLSDSLTLTIDISVIYKEDDWGVLDVRWLRTTQKITEISWFRACVPLSTEGTETA